MNEDQYKQFLEILNTMVTARIKQLDGKPGCEEASELAGTVFDALKDNSAVELMCAAANAQHSVVKQAIATKVALFNAAVREGRPGQPQHLSSRPYHKDFAAQSVRQ